MVRDLEQSQAQPGINNVSFVEAAALVCLWSVLIINEGTMRFISSSPTIAKHVRDEPFSFLAFLAALVQVCFGLVGLFVGVVALVLNKHRVAATKVAMSIQSALSLFVFVVLVFVLPARRIDQMETPLGDGLSLRASKFLVANGMLAAWAMCFSGLGGQWLFMSRMVASASGTDFCKATSGNRYRSILWGLNLSALGLSALIAGALIGIEQGTGILDAHVMASPHIVSLPVSTILVGLAMLLTGALGVLIAIGRQMCLVPVFYVAIGLLYFSILCSKLLGEIGAIVGGPAIASGIQSNLFFTALFLPLYYMRQFSCQDKDGSAMLVTDGNGDSMA